MLGPVSAAANYQLRKVLKRREKMGVWGRGEGHTNTHPVPVLMERRGDGEGRKYFKDDEVKTNPL